VTAAPGSASDLAPALGKRERTKLANRAAILDAARDVFAEIGYGAAGVRDIVRRTGLAAGTFYNYFPDKEAVFRALLKRSSTEVRTRVRAARRAARTPEEFVRGGYEAYYGFLAEDRGTFELMRRNAGTIRTLFDEPVLWAGVRELRADLEEAITAGAFPALDSEYMASAMVGAGFEIAVLMVERDPPDVAGAAAFASSLFLGGIERIGTIEAGAAQQAGL
jgi:AcrR family transcriptional regulator